MLQKIFKNMFFLFFIHFLQCTLNLLTQVLTQVNNNLYKCLRLAEIPVRKTGVPGVKIPTKGICRAPYPAEVCRRLVKESQL